MTDPDPYALIFAAPRFEEDAFPAIEAEARERGIRSDDPDAFRLLATAGELLREMPGPAEPGSTGARADLGPFAALLFHAFQFHRFGRLRWTLDAELLEWLLGGEVRIGAWRIAPPAPAGYLRLPRQRVWSRVADDVSAEPVDGFFWSMVGTEDPAAPPHDRLNVLLCLGVRAGRPGLTVIETAVRLPSPDGGHFGDVEARPGEEDFANVLPGGELKGLHALVNVAEVLKLVSRVFWYIATHPAAVSQQSEADPATLVVRLQERAHG